MRTLNTVEINKVSGAFDTVTTCLIASTAINFGLGFYTLNQLHKTQAILADSADLLYMMAYNLVYANLQLSWLPGYNEAYTYSLDQAMYLVSTS